MSGRSSALCQGNFAAFHFDMATSVCGVFVALCTLKVCSFSESRESSPALFDLYVFLGFLLFFFFCLLLLLLLLLLSSCALKGNEKPLRVKNSVDGKLTRRSVEVLVAVRCEVKKRHSFFVFY